MTIVILVAGSGRRFRDTKPKSLSMVKDKSLLQRTLEQIRKLDQATPIRVVTGYKSEAIEEELNDLKIDGLTIVENKEFAKDQNIISAQMGMLGVDSDVLVLEGDCIYNEASIREFLNELGSGKNIIFTFGNIDRDKKNAIIRCDSGGLIDGYIIGDKPRDLECSEWSNMAGAVLFSRHDLTDVRGWLKRTGADPSKTYYFHPLTDLSEDSGLDVLVSRLGGDSEFSTFNTQKQYLDVMKEMGVETQIQLIDVRDLLISRDYDDTIVENEKRLFLDGGLWKKPICIDSEFSIVLEGENRIEAAKQIGLNVVPAISFDLSEVRVTPNSNDMHEIDYDMIFSRLKSGEVYPLDNFSISFDSEIPECSIDLEELA